MSTDSTARYDIVRFRSDEEGSVVVKADVSLAEARAHCQDEATHGPDWFDGYRERVTP